MILNSPEGQIADFLLCRLYRLDSLVRRDGRTEERFGLKASASEWLFEFEREDRPGGLAAYMEEQSSRIYESIPAPLSKEISPIVEMLEWLGNASDAVDELEDLKARVSNFKLALSRL